MSKNEKKLLPIDYTHREFESIQQDLLEIAERFYPDSFQDFSEASFGALMLDAVSYVGDQLSFYLDYNVNESFLDTSFQYSNVVRHGAIMGYKFGGRPSTYGSVALFLLVLSDGSQLLAFFFEPVSLHLQLAYLAVEPLLFLLVPFVSSLAAFAQELLGVVQNELLPLIHLSRVYTIF